MSENKSLKKLNRKEALRKCKQMEMDIQNALEAKRKYPLTSSKKNMANKGFEDMKEIPRPDFVEKAKKLILQQKPVPKHKSNLTQKVSLTGLQPPKAPNGQQIIGPKRAGTGISEVLKASPNIDGAKFIKEFDDVHKPKDSSNNPMWCWGGEQNRKVISDLPLGDNVKQNKSEHKTKAVTEADPKDLQKSAEEDAERIKRIIAKEKRLRIKQARMDWEKDNELRERPQKPKDAIGDMFYVPVPDNKIKPEEFKNNYSKYISKFEQKFRQKLSEKINKKHIYESIESGYPSEKREDALRDAYYRLLQASTRNT